MALQSALKCESSRLESGQDEYSLQTVPRYLFEQGNLNEINFISGWDNAPFVVGHLEKGTNYVRTVCRC